MVVNNIILKNREVVYVCEERKNNENKIVTNYFIRVENINGKLHTSLLPKKFTLENNNKTVTIKNDTSINISAENAYHNVIVKLGSPKKQMGVFDIDKESNASDLTDEEFVDCVQKVAKVERYEENYLDILTSLFGKAFDNISDLDKPIKVYPFDSETYDPYNLPLLYNFDYLAKQREEALKTLEPYTQLSIPVQE